MSFKYEPSSEPQHISLESSPKVSVCNAFLRGLAPEIAWKRGEKVFVGNHEELYRGTWPIRN